MKTLSSHEKINVRAWMSRCTNGGVPLSVRVALPLREVLRIGYAITGRSAADLSGEQPPLVRSTIRSPRPSDATRFDRRRKFGSRAA